MKGRIHFVFYIFSFFIVMLAFSACSNDGESVNPASSGSGAGNNDTTEADTLLSVPPPTPYSYPNKNILPWSNRFEPTDNPTTVQGAELGKFLFYDKRLSRDSSVSCGSCHKQHLAFTDGSAFSLGIDNQLGTRSAMSLVNFDFLGSKERYFWDGRAESLEDLVHFPINDPVEMDESINNIVVKIKDDADYKIKFQKAFGSAYIDSARVVKAIAQFMRTLVSNDSKYDRYLRNQEQLTASEKRGLDLLVHPEPSFGLRGGNCTDCHEAPLFNFSQLFKNNGLQDPITDIGLEAVTGNPADRGKMKIVTLRNIAVTGPYMHDGRFSTLREVLEDHYNDPSLFNKPNLDPLIPAAANAPYVNVNRQLGLFSSEIDDIISFLNTLTDSTFLTNPEYANPWKNH